MRHTRTGWQAVVMLALAVVWSAGAQQTGQETLARPDAARFATRADEILSSGQAGKADWGALVIDAASGEILYARSANRYFQPASNAKLFTTAMALATLGPEFRIRTTIEASRAVDREGRLAGDLVLVGRGDPNLSNRVLPFGKKDERDGPLEKVLAQMADQMAAHGLKRVDGDVVADDSYFYPARFPSGWTVDDTVWNYGSAISAIAFNDNAMTLMVRPGAAVGARLRTELAPAGSIYEVRCDGVTTAAGTQPQLRLERDPESRIFRISGSLPVDAAPRPLIVAVPEPAENAAALLLHIVKERGIRVAGRAIARHVDESTLARTGEAGGVVLAEHLSRPLTDDVRLTNKLSLNLHAELMLRVAAKEKGAAMTMDDALMFASQFRQSIGVAPDDVMLTDGSGLARGDLVTPQAFVQLLQDAERQPWGADFLASLPVAGEDGTLESRMKGTAAAGQIHAKTGELDHVNALSGYATTARGERLIFSIMGNNEGMRGADGRAVVDAFCVAMVEELGPEADPATPAPQR